MPDLATVTSAPEVKSAVLGDLEGTFLDAFNEADGETIAAVMGFVSATVLAAGALLGLGALRRISLSGPSQASVVVIQDRSVIAAAIEPPRALGAVEKFLESVP